MGKATIMGGGPDGNYSIKIDYGKAIRDAKVAKLDARIAELSPQITEADSAYTIQQAEVAAANNAVNEAIDAYVLATQADPDPATHKPALEAFKTAAKRARLEQGRAFEMRIVLDALVAEKNQAVRDKGYWEGLELEVTQAAWCVDYTDDAVGEVATVDVPGESDTILVAAGGVAHDASFGQLAAREVQSPDQVFFNAAILPGWQKFKPVYRIGVIDALDVEADMADVTLEPATSSAQNLDINRYTDLPGIAIEYMDCNAAAFEVGDRVIVKFEGQEWNGAKVIGFASNPKPCWPVEFYATLEAPVQFLTEGEYFYLCWLKTGGEIGAPCDAIENNFYGAPESRVKVQIEDIDILNEAKYPNVVLDPEADTILFEKTSLDEEGKFVSLDSNVNESFFRIAYLRKNKGGANTFVITASSDGMGGCNVIESVSGYASDPSFESYADNFTTPDALFTWLGGEDLPPVNLKNTESERTKAYYPVGSRKIGAAWQIIYRRDDLVD